MSAAPDIRLLALVPARGGSKGVPRKNLRDLGGRPLLHWTVGHALSCGAFAAVVVSTDDPEIRASAIEAGAEAPYLRDPALATDTAPTLPVVLEALDRLAPTLGEFDAVCLLQPTSPYRAPDLVPRAVQLLEGADSVVAVRRIPAEHHPDWALVEADGHAAWATGLSEPPPRRQDLRPAFHRDGSLYLTRTHVIRAGSLYGARPRLLEVTTPQVNIDTLEDWEHAERVVAALGDPASFRTGSSTD